LTKQVLESAISVEQAEDQVLEFVKSHIPEQRIAPLAGNSVHADKRFLEKEMPRLVEHLHYRIVGKWHTHLFPALCAKVSLNILDLVFFFFLDVSTVKELSRRWYPQVYEGLQKKGAHRALDDIVESIDELKYYRKHIFKWTVVRIKQFPFHTKNIE
jgi:oligoribonuclease